MPVSTNDEPGDATVANDATFCSVEESKDAAGPDNADDPNRYATAADRDQFYRHYNATELGPQHVAASFRMGYHSGEKRFASGVLSLYNDILSDRTKKYDQTMQFLKRQATAANTAEDNLIAQKRCFHDLVDKDLGRAPEDDLDTILANGEGPCKAELVALMQKSKRQQQDAKKAKEAKQLQDTVTFSERIGKMRIIRRGPFSSGKVTEEAIDYWPNNATASWEAAEPILNACLVKLGRKLNKSQTAIVAWLTELILMKKMPSRQNLGAINVWTKRLIC